MMDPSAGGVNHHQYCPALLADARQEAPEICAVERDGSVGRQEGGRDLDHHLNSLMERLKLIVRVVGVGVEDAVQYPFTREALAFDDCEKADRLGSAFSIDLQALFLDAFHVGGRLASVYEHVIYQPPVPSEVVEDVLGTCVVREIVRHRSSSPMSWRGGMGALADGSRQGALAGRGRSEVGASVCTRML